jgi:hypothetical protein
LSLQRCDAAELLPLEALADEQVCSGGVIESRVVLRGLREREKERMEGREGELSKQKMTETNKNH